jgi:tetratricopeptide (TPR) repeat protein
MPGEIDVYQPCPCGSGKKLKFCCQAIVADMVKVSDLQQSHQHQAALKLLEIIEKKPQPRDVWPRAWVKTTKAFLLFSLGEIEEPRRLVGEVLEELPEHPLAVAVKAVLAVSADGYPAAMRAVYRAYEISAEAQPFLTSHLAATVSHLLLAKGHFLAARQHLQMAVVFDHENEEVAKGFLMFVRDMRMPWLVRDGYLLAPFRGNENLKPQFDAGVRLASRGCFSDAAKAFGSVARQEPKQPGLWWNIALCHAWAGEDPLAIEALKAAAANQPDFEAQVDCLALARQLRTPEAQDKVPHLTAPFSVESVGKLLTALDQRPEFSRVEQPEPEPDDDAPRPAGMYQVLDRDPNLIPPERLLAENVAHVLGDLVVFDRQEDGSPAKAFVSAYGREILDRMISSFTEVAGPLAASEGEPREHGYVAKEHFPLLQDWYLPANLSHAQRNDLHRAASRHIIEDVWPTIPQEALGGRSPRDAAQVPELRAALTAAVVSLDAFCEKNGLVFDEGAARERLGLPALALTPLSEDDPADAPTLLRLRHTNVSELSDEQLMRAADNVMRLQHSALCSTVVGELLARPAIQEKIDVPRLCMLLSRVCARRLDIDAALEWVVRGKQECKARKLSLDTLALWEIQELMLRSQRPDDPQTAVLANTLWNYYLPKLPEIREVLAGIFDELSLKGPWKSGQMPLAGTAPLAPAGVGASSWWTPESQAAGQPSKLWLPGQE